MDQFNDPQLSVYINDVAKFNFDLQTAIARIQEERALRSGAKSNLYPQIDASTKYSRYQLFASSTELSSGLSRAASSFTGNKVLSTYNAGFDSSWEIDFWGKNRWNVVAATENIEVANENKRAVLISLISELARNYMELRGNQSQLAVLRKNIENQSNSLKFIQSRYKIGLSPEIDVISAQSLLESLKSQIPNLEASIKASAYNISVLTGRNPEVLLNELLLDKPLPTPVDVVAVGLPADLILRRPDIRQAQRNLGAAIASVGAAKADLYPNIKFNGSFGFEKIKIGDLINFTGGLWSISPSIDWKIFDRRSLKANLDANKAKAKSADAELRQTVLNAIKDVDTSISNLDSSRKTEKELENTTLSSQQAYNMTTKSYEIGLKSQLDTLDAEKTYINDQSQLITSKTQINLQIINLYKALGGGWQYF